MRTYRFVILALALSIAVAGCRSQKMPMPAAGAPAAGMSDAGMSGASGQWQSAGAGGQSGAAGDMAAACSDDLPTKMGIASVPLNSPPPLKLTESVQLLGDGLPLTLMEQQNPAAGLRWMNDRMFMLADSGFWDIPVDRPARWYPTKTSIIWGSRAGDLDGDGDQDMILFTMEVNPSPPSDGTGSPILTRLTAWERTPDGLVERGEVMHVAEMRLGLPYALGDVDKDGDLDVLAFEMGAPVAYLNDGKFGFKRTMVGEVAPDLMNFTVIFVNYSDRNQDGSPDLLVVAGNPIVDPLGNSMFVLLSDGAGKFGKPGPSTMGNAPLVPYGPDGFGLGAADVTGDGIADMIAQDAQGTDTPILRLYASSGPSNLMPARQVQGLGFEFADVDEDGKTDIVTTLNNRLTALLSRANGSFESRDLGISTAELDVADYVVDPGVGSAPAVVHTLYKLRACPACDADRSDRCLFGTDVGCLSDADCAPGRCQAQTCVP